MSQMLTAPPPASPAAPASVSPDGPEVRRVLLSDVSWDTYSALLNSVGDGATRLTYDSGWLEIEMPGPLHEKIKKFASAMVEKVLERQRVPFEPYGGTTWRRHEWSRGLEADECYYVQNASLVAGRAEPDLMVDPPPDLAIEVEMTSPLLDKVAVYRGLRVPELWRVRADCTCDMLLLDTAGAYLPTVVSVAVPPVTPAIVSQYLRLRAETSHSAAMARFEAEFLVTVSPAV